jgi:hypothetical protein
MRVSSVVVLAVVLLVGTLVAGCGSAASTPAATYHTPTVDAPPAPTVDSVPQPAGSKPSRADLLALDQSHGALGHALMVWGHNIKSPVAYARVISRLKALRAQSYKLNQEAVGSCQDELGWYTLAVIGLKGGVTMMHQALLDGDATTESTGIAAAKRSEQAANRHLVALSKVCL